VNIHKMEGNFERTIWNTYKRHLNFAPGKNFVCLELKIFKVCLNFRYWTLNTYKITKFWSHGILKYLQMN
jgi:hypothetical protein